MKQIKKNGTEVTVQKHTALSSVGWMAVGSMAVGAAAFGAIAIGALAIGKFDKSSDLCVGHDGLGRRR